MISKAIKNNKKVEDRIKADSTSRYSAFRNERRELAEFFDDWGHFFDDVIDFFFGVVSAQTEPYRAVGGGEWDAHRAQDVGGLE